MALRTSIPQSELREKLSSEQLESGPVYRGSQGGWVQDSPRPVAGTPNGTNGRLSQGS
ncbi:hypothetical protein [Streptomyces sp. MJM1172]|uniref:hypothetical protein n=1 Tax=Streptomyces sp. MJM1172 TaxID=1703926 RepID=UPI000B04F932|nr:hypothetical protein [Streptomyces sp. MJM1172]